MLQPKKAPAVTALVTGQVQASFAQMATEAVKPPSFVKNIQPELQRMPREEALAAIERVPDARVRARWRSGGQRDLAHMRIGAHMGERGDSWSHHP